MLGGIQENVWRIDTEKTKFLDFSCHGSMPWPPMENRNAPLERRGIHTHNGVGFVSKSLK